MALHTHKRLKKLGFPEVITVVLIALASVTSTMWWRDANQPEWTRTEGRILECDIRETHYNAEDYRPKVTLSYEYDVGTTRHTGSYAGFWPEVNSVNALPPSRYGELRSREFGLTVYYYPKDPGVSQLHLLRVDHKLLLGILAIVSFLGAGVYCVKVYPAWRWR